MYYKTILGTVICMSYLGISLKLPFTTTPSSGKVAESAIIMCETNHDVFQAAVSALLEKEDFSVKFMTLSGECYQICGTLKAKAAGMDIQYRITGSMEEINQNINEIKSSEIIKKHVSMRVIDAHKKEFELYGDLYQNQNKELFLYGWIVGIL